MTQSPSTPQPAEVEAVPQTPSNVWQTQAPPVYVAPPVPQVPGPDPRYMPPPPLGGSPVRVDGVTLTEIGARLGAMGMESSAVTSLWHSLQAASVQVWLAQLPELLNKIDKVNRAKFNRAMQLVRELPEATPPQGMFSRIVNGNQAVVSYVDRAAVLQLLATVMEQVPASTR